MKNIFALFLATLLLPNVLLAQQEQDDSLSGLFADPSNLTDKQMNDAKEFTHEGIKQRVVKEGCDKADNCQDSDEGFPVEMMIGKAYALMGLISGDGGMMPKLNTKPAALSEEAVAAGEKPEKGKQNDYCMLTAMTYETLGGQIQQMLQKKAENTAPGIGDVQLQSLINLKETHKARQKTANMQAYVYTGVTACYTAMLFSQTVSFDTSFYAKYGGAAALAGLYYKKARKHEKAAKQVQLVINSLEWAGKDCNPWTKTSCFCSEPTSKTVYPAEYYEVCELNKGNFDTPKMALGCAAVGEANKLTFDQDCKCKTTNSCLKSTLKLSNPTAQMGNNLMMEANKTFDLISGGTIDQGQIDRAVLNTANLAARVKEKAKVKTAPQNLTVEEKKIADELKKYMPDQLAEVAATASPAYTGGIKDSPTTAGSASISKLSPAIKKKLADTISVGYKKGNSQAPAVEEPEFTFTLPKMPGQEPEASSGVEVLTFAEQAISKAEVTNKPSTPIFEIISNRYRMSGWKKLESEKK